MIYTVTFNPSLDYIVSVDDFKLGKTNRTTKELMLPGGKGLNVSTVLHNLGIENTALGFCAGFVGEELKRLVKETGYQCDFIDVKNGVSRINVKLKDFDGTEINGMGPVIDDEAMEQLWEKLNYLKEGDTLAAICKTKYGSLVQLEEICTINNIKNADYIAPGQKIYLP